MAITRAQQLKELVPGLHKLFGLTYMRYAEQWRECFDLNTSDRSFEEETKLSGFGVAPDKTEGAPIEYDTAQEVWTARYVHQTVAMGFALTEEAMEDNLYESLSARYTKAMAKSMNYTKNLKGAAIFNNAFDNNFPGGDAVSLCSTSHPILGGGFNANRPATGVDLNETSLEAAAIQISKWVDERNLLIAAKIKRMLIPADLQFVAQRLLETKLRTGTSDNDISAIYTLNTVPSGYTVNNFFTDPNGWFLTTDVDDGLKFFQRVRLTTKADGDFDTGNMRYKARERYCFGFSDPLGVWGSPGST
jgi:hypothetical protein